MSTNHNRIRVADLEKNQPNKILKTNQNGELEFSDANNFQAESYNALDCTTEGKTLDARQGKVLKDMIENVSTSPVSLVNDLTTGGTNKALTAEMGKQLDETKHPLEDQRLSQDQTVKFGRVIVKDGKYVSYIEPFQVLAQNAETYFSTKLTPDAIIAQSNGARKLEVKYNSINFVEDPYTDKKGSLQTQFLTGARSWQLQDKDGIVALTNDNVVTAPGNTIRPSLIIPNGTLTTTPANGAIERDENGVLWETHNSIRSRLITTSDNLIPIAYKATTSMQTNLDLAVSSTSQYVSTNISAGKFSNASVQRLNASTVTVTSTYNSTGLKPTIAKTEVFLKINNGLFTTHFSGSNPANEVKIMEYSGLNNYGYKNYQNLLLFNIQNANPLLAQWSTIDFNVQTINDGKITTEDKSYYLRDSINSRSFGASEASFSIVFRNTLAFTDENNNNGLNAKTLVRATNYALFIETIR
jgi:hypothetical protein